jgi:hypothetical protein
VPWVYTFVFVAALPLSPRRAGTRSTWPRGAR